MKIPPSNFRSFYPHFTTVFCAAILLMNWTFARAAVHLPDGTIPSNMAVQLKGADMNKETLDKVKELGFTRVRRGFIWDTIEKEKAVYNFESYDKFVALCRERNLGLIVPIVFSNKLYGHVKDEPGRSAYASFAAKLVERYKGEDIYWEIWNEPNTMTFWGKHGKKGNSDSYAEEYTNLVKATIPEMRKANPDCVILAGAVSNMWTESYKWMGFCFAKGMLKQDWDVWSVHPYGLRYPEDYTEAYKITRDLMNAAGGPSDKPWINSERGFPVDKKKEGFAGGEEARLAEYQAWYLVRQALIDLMEGVNVTCWYEWGGNEGFALYKKEGPTPAYKACKVLIDQLSGYKLEKRLETKEPRDYVLCFKNASGGVKLVVWAAPEKGKTPEEAKDHAVSIPVEASGTLDTADVYGKSGKIDAKSGKIDVPLTGAPQYITLKK